MESTPDDVTESSEQITRPVSDDDATVVGDGREDPVQVEWDRTEAVEGGATDDDLDPATMTGADPTELPSPEDEIPAEDRVGSLRQPDTQGADPLLADIGEDGEGDLGEGDL